MRPAGGRRVALSVPAELDGQRLDRALARMMPALSRSYLKKLALDGLCRVNSAPAAPDHTVRRGDRIVLELTEPPRLPCHAEDGPLQVLREDERVLVVAKPAGMVTHPSKGHSGGTLLNFVVGHLEAEIARGWSRPHIMTRLDRYTSGLVLIAKTPPAHRSLQQALDERRISRRYLALVWGAVEAQEGEVVAALELDRQEGLRMVVSEEGRQARTSYLRRRLFPLPGPVGAAAPRAASHLHNALHTGRTHQIRAHMAALGHPVIGDDLYGPEDLRRPSDPDLAALIGALGGYALHARELRFPDPACGGEVRVAAAPPAPFLTLLAWLHGGGEPRRRPGG